MEHFCQICQILKSLKGVNLTLNKLKSCFQGWIVIGKVKRERLSIAAAVLLAAQTNL